MTPENQAIKFHEEKKTKLQTSRVKKILALNKLKQEILDAEESIKEISSEVIKVEDKIKFWKDQKFWKRKCFALVREHDYIGFDDHDYEVSEGAFWFWSADFEEDDTSDPYHDAHFCDSWGELHSALKKYVKIRRFAELDREEANEKV